LIANSNSEQRGFHSGLGKANGPTDAALKEVITHRVSFAVWQCAVTAIRAGKVGLRD
jgi:hypothetical protein